jgi:hypothetical protein
MENGVSPTPPGRPLAAGNSRGTLTPQTEMRTWVLCGINKNVRFRPLHPAPDPDRIPAIRSMIGPIAAEHFHDLVINAEQQKSRRP